MIYQIAREPAKHAKHAKINPFRVISRVSRALSFATNISAAAVLIIYSPGLTLRAATMVSPVPDKIVCAVHDRQDMQVSDRVTLGGWIGARVTANEHNRLAAMDVDRLLEGYRKRPGRQIWDGEHVGKWLHAATLAWVNTGDPALRKRMDYVVAELIKCQEGDGYLGTYLAAQRWTEWDVWAHKYNLIGLVTYMRYTGNKSPMPACRRMADLLCRTFGEQPGQLDIIKAGQHKGLAPTSVLEPMVLLYRLTGEPRYLDFCKYILRSWERQNGPKVVSTLLTSKRVVKVGNAKAYEMLSCLNGALEYYRTVGDREILQACLNAWQDIVDHQLYPTGTASYREFFHADNDLPNVNNVGETCVTVTWLQFNAQLLRLTGEVRFAEQLEKVVLNQLFGAQRCDGTAWGYYVQMEGKKPYSSVLDGHCCLSSGPRGIALIPTFAVSADDDGAVVNLYESSTARLKLRHGPAVTLITDTRYPSEGRILITVTPEKRTKFAIKLRVPAWCSRWSIRVNGNEQSRDRLPRRSEAAAGEGASSAAPELKVGPDGYVALHREWKKGDRIELDLDLQPRVLVGQHNNEGKVALMYGPLVLAADESLLPEGGSLPRLRLAETNLSNLHFTQEFAQRTPMDGRAPSAWSQVYRCDALVRALADTLESSSPVRVGLLPFAEAGGTGFAYKVWLPCGDAEKVANKGN
ncbi:MAG: hypothetical protein C5B50_01475 [Verrucomicrobia bacterium]|nr:MAG: hypothetical protein C5B50_01475 [Verrucomicrobiota bacterium]